MKNIFKKVIPMLILMAFGFSILFLQSCKKNNSNGSNVAYNNSSKVIASIIGIVTDESGVVIDNATVTTGTYSTTTDVNGFFHFDNITTPSHATTVLVSKNTYFKGSKTLSVNANQKHIVKVSLIAKGVPQSFIASNGGVVNFANGLSIDFPANGIINQTTGVAYSGKVYVYAHKIDPTTEAGINIMPGDLRGINTGGEEKLLQSFGMMVAELYTVDGQLLQIKNGSEATITLTVPSSISAAAPQSIPLWYFDEAKGIWVEEGYATLTDGKYVGKVKHFSFWNCDTPAAAINLEMTLVDQNGNPLDGYFVKLTNNANNDTRGGTTNTSGWVGGLVYPNATLTMKVYSLSSICGSMVPIYTQTVVTSSINLSLGTITIPITLPSSATITGSIIDCSSNSISNASILIQPYNILVTPNSLGQFTYTLPCTPTIPITLYTYDLTNNVYGISSPILLTTGNNNLGVLNACGNVGPFIGINITNTNTSMNYSHTITLTNGGSIKAMIDSNIASSNSSINTNDVIGTSYNYLNLITTDTLVGTYAITNFSAFFSSSGFPDQNFTLNSGSTITYTAFPLFPNDVLGNYTLNLTGNTTGNTYTATGSFRAPRQN